MRTEDPPPISGLRSEVRCFEGLNNWADVQWHYGDAAAPFATFAALMATVSATAIVFLISKENAADLGDALNLRTRRVMFGGLMTLIVATIMFGEVSGEHACRRAVAAGTLASHLLTIGTLLTVIALVPYALPSRRNRALRRFVALGGVAAFAAAMGSGVYISLTLLNVADGERVSSGAWLVGVILAVLSGLWARCWILGPGTVRSLWQLERAAGAAVVWASAAAIASYLAGLAMGIGLIDPETVAVVFALIRACSVGLVATSMYYYLVGDTACHEVDS